MVMVLHPPGGAPAARCLEALPVKLVPLAGGAIPRLTEASADQVCVVTQAETQRPEWARLRVQLARANRYFLVEMTRPGTGEIVAAMRDGAFDVLSTEDNEERWFRALSHAAESQHLWVRLYASRLDVEAGRLVGRSASMAALRQDIERLGRTDVTVLIIGESGVGKERIASALHEASREGPLVTLNCAAMPRDLLEAELFGAEKGAFTGALKSRPGLVEQADGGSLFLDEIGEMDITLQPKLLRFLETRRARRVGGEREYSVNLRVIAATNRDLEMEIRSGRFRPDLYYRLAEVVLRVPPLRDRVEDIPDLAVAFMQGANERFGKNVEALEPELITRLQRYPWPGNVRELKSVIDRLVLFHEGPVLREGWWDPPPARVEEERRPLMAGPTAWPAAPFAPEAVLPAPVVALPSRSGRIQLARRLLAEGQLSLTEVAARTGVHPTTLFRWRRSGKV